MKKNIFNKWLIVISVLCLTIAGILFSYLKSKNSELVNISTPSINLPSFVSQNKDCNSYTPDIGNGQYYYFNLPKLITNDLNYKSGVGKQLKVSGFVYGSNDDSVPLAKAKIELWQPDPNGIYRPKSSGDYDKIEKDDLAFRGYIETDEKGYYEYFTIIPGEFENTPRHSAFRVSKDGYQAVSTQLVYSLPEDKSKIDNYEITKSLLDCQIFKNITQSDGVYIAKYNFRLKK